MRFRPSQCKCLVFGSNPFVTKPTWNIHVGYNILLTENNKTYENGVEMSGSSNGDHSVRWVRCAREALCALQVAGIKYEGVSIETAMIIVKTAVIVHWPTVATAK